MRLLKPCVAVATALCSPIQRSDLHKMMSLSARITLSAALVLAIFIALTGVALDRAFHDSAQQARQDRLLGQVYLLIAAAEVAPDGALSVPATLSESKFNLPASGLYAYVLDSQGKTRWQSPSALGIKLPSLSSLKAGQKNFSSNKNQNGESFYIQGFGVRWEAQGKHYPFTFYVIENLSEFNAQMNRYRQSLWIWLGAMTVLLLATQAFILRWGLRPLRKVASELTSIESGKQARLEGAYPAEIKLLTDNLNTLLEHEREQQARYRNALADLAHSLKTPLAVIRAALAPAHPDQLDLTTLEDEVQRINRIVDYQLQRAATSGRSNLMAPVAIKPIVVKLIHSLNKVYHEKSVHADIQIDDDTLFFGDEGDLIEMLGNLLDNAYKWCKKSVQITAENNPAILIIRVEDDGNGIEADHLQRILERGIRADETVPGHGIGLAVVCDIVHTYKGNITISPSLLGGGAISIEFLSTVR